MFKFILEAIYRERKRRKVRELSFLMRETYVYKSLRDEIGRVRTTACEAHDLINNLKEK